jgi:hypothetical protein
MSQTGPPSILEHNLNQYFPELLKFESTAELERSELWKRIGPEAERVLDAVVVVNAASEPTEGRTQSAPVRALAWNLERGNKYGGITGALKDDPRLSDRDVLLLSELDYGMARSGNRFVAKELAEELELNWAFAPV